MACLKEASVPSLSSMMTGMSRPSSARPCVPGVEGDGAVERLLDEGGEGDQARQGRGAAHGVHQARDVLHALVLLVAVQRDQVGLGDQAVEGRGDAPEAVQVGIELAADLELEVAEPLELHALLERLREPVPEPAVGRHVRGDDGVEKPLCRTASARGGGCGPTRGCPPAGPECAASGGGQDVLAQHSTTSSPARVPRHRPAPARASRGGREVLRRDRGRAAGT